MKKLIVLLVLSASVSAGSAQVDPTRPMVTGRGNVAVRPVKVMVTNQTLEKADEPVLMEAISVTGSLIRTAVKVAKPIARR